MHFAHQLILLSACLLWRPHACHICPAEEICENSALPFALHSAWSESEPKSSTPAPPLPSALPLVAPSLQNFAPEEAKFPKDSNLENLLVTGIDIQRQGQPISGSSNSVLALPNLQGQPPFPAALIPARRSSTAFFEGKEGPNLFDLMDDEQQKRPIITKYPLAKSQKSLVFIFLFECFFLVALNSFLL